VGAATETEMKEKKARVEDALHATRAAVEEGIVPGGRGRALVVPEAPREVRAPMDDEKTGHRIVAAGRSTEPIRIIVRTPGAEGRSSSGR